MKLKICLFFAIFLIASSKRKRGGSVPENETATTEEKIP